MIVLRLAVTCWQISSVFYSFLDKLNQKEPKSCQISKFKLYFVFATSDYLNKVDEGNSNI
jgi:hypothetical protein